MKNKLIIGLIISSVFLTGCSGNSSASIKELSNQIDFTSNTISSVSEINTTIPSTNELRQSLDSVFYNSAFEKSKKKIENQETLKSGIQGKLSLIKKHIEKSDLNLSRTHSSALNDLSKNLKKYSKKLEETKNEYFQSVKGIDNIIQKDETTNMQISAKINNLSNCLETRSCFYQNILNTLTKIEDLFEIEDNSFQESAVSDENEEVFKENDKDEKEYIKDLQELYYRNKLEENKLANDNQEPVEEMIEEESLDIENPEIMQQSGIKNTDSYRPLYTNIDTYRPFGFRNGGMMNGYGGRGGYGYGGYPENNQFNYGGNGITKATGFNQGIPASTKPIQKNNRDNAGLKILK